MGKTHSSTSPDPSFKHSIWRLLFEPNAKILTDLERRQAGMISALLFVLALTMISGVVYMGFFSPNPAVGIILAGSDIVIGIAYIISRTQYYRLAAFLSLIVLSIIPVLDVIVDTEHSAESLLVLLIWNILTILLCSVMMSMRVTILFAIENFLILLLIPAFVTTVSFKNMILPLIFNFVIPFTILVFTQHRNLMEKDRLAEVSRAYKQLQIEFTERKRVEEQLAYSALHDSLTNLSNRILFMDRLCHAMERAKRHEDFTFAVIFIDLDHFKVVNDSLGHEIGDLLLIECAQRLTRCVRSEDTVARLGGDEFVILLEEVENFADYARVAERILNDLALPAYLEDHKVFISASMGVLFSDIQYQRPEDILRDADIAMYYAKRQGRGHYEIFDPAMRDRVLMRMELETDLRNALENNEFIIHYQPILDTKTQRIIGFEALLRWQHPTKGLFQPAEFIPIAEETGLIVPIGYWVLNEACCQIYAWQEQFPANPPLTMNVNLSIKQCIEPDLVEQIAKILQKTGLSASCLKLEMTESLIIEDSKPVTSMLLKLRKLGIQVHIDDFGTGYSSLGYLHTLPIDTLKIDRTFIGQLGISGTGSEIVRTIMALAHNLGMKVIAEGVETDDQLSKLKAMDCEYIQGFLFAKPVDSREAVILLEDSFTKVEDKLDEV